MKNVEISYFAAESFLTSDLTYVIIGARENNKWIFVRHSERNTWELPAGHIEKNESALDAAKRELYEETGVTEAVYHSIKDYAVTVNGDTKYGRIYLAKVNKRVKLPDFEIEEIKIQHSSPEPATYPVAHKSFLNLLESHVHQH